MPSAIRDAAPEAKRNSPPPPLVLLGAGGHGRAVLELIRDAGLPDPVGVLDDDPASAGLPGLPLLGPLALAESLRGQGVAAAHVALGHNARRAALGAWLAGLGYVLPLLRHPSAIVAGTARIEGGSALLPRVVVGAAAAVGAGAILNTGCIVEHDCRIGEAVHVAPGAVLGGGVTVGARALVGLGACLRPGVTVGEDAVIGVGAAVVAAVAAGARVSGVPAVPLR